ncbi:MAG TPA: aminotransferase class I/II-fold pyridoxal phosphate-dependent enzyme, partial [Casimicrobiaceae bacterium]|nr:aminotransferase class I/II-fold pyridoxal phosphate-dependent enzyme [Casimicrobiaceae bacterium]
NTAGIRQLAEGVRALGLAFVPSHANFLLVRVGDAAAIYQRLLEQGVIVRPVAGYGLPEFLRVTVGLPAENRRFLDALAAALGR